MDQMYTKNGRPLRLSGDRVFGPSGRQVAKIRGRKAFGPDGRYVGTVVGNRLIYRSTDSASVGSPFAPAHRAPSARMNRVPTAKWGEEPPIAE